MEASRALRSFIEQMDLDTFVEKSHRYTKLPIEDLKDATLEVLASMLAREEQFLGRFENIHLFSRYVRKSAVHRIYRHYRKESRYPVTDVEELPDAESTPEAYLLSALAHISTEQLFERAASRVEKSVSMRKDLQLLFRTLLDSPEKFTIKRKSGTQAGNLTLDITRLAKATKWNRQKVYERLQRLRKILLQEMQG